MQFITGLTPANAPARTIYSYGHFIVDAIIFYIMTGQRPVNDHGIAFMSWIIDFRMKPVAIFTGIISAAIIRK